MNNKLIESTKLLTVKYQQEAAQAYIDGNQTKQAVCHEYVAAGLSFLEMLHLPETLTVPYTRHGNGIPEQMIPIGPHQTVQKAYYDRHFAKATTTTKPTDDNKELPSGEAG